MVLAAILALFGSTWTVQEPAPPNQEDKEAEKRISEEELLQKLANPLAAVDKVAADFAGKASK